MTNKVFLIGRLTADPTIRQAGDSQVASFTVACDTNHKDEAGQRVSNFYSVTAWRKLAEICGKYLHKGDKVSIVGDLFLRKYVDKNGAPRISPDVTATDMEMLSERKQDGQNQQGGYSAPVSAQVPAQTQPYRHPAQSQYTAPVQPPVQQRQYQAAPPQAPEYDDDDLPF